jgi:pantothenate kinase
MPPPGRSSGAAPQVDMLVGDIYGERDYSSIGLSASTIASSFGKAGRRPHGSLS